jgi:hypothetical protein
MFGLYRYFQVHLLDAMSFFLAFTLLASLTCFNLSCFVSASPAPLLDALQLPSKRSATVLSTSAQLLVSQTIAAQKATGNQWDLLAAKALSTLVEYVEANGWPNPKCTFDNISVRREW